MHRIRSMFNARSSVYRVHQRGSDKADKRETALLFVVASGPSIIQDENSQSGDNRGGERERRIPLLPRSIEFGSSETESAAKPWPRSGGSKKGTRRCNGSGNFWGREGVIHGGGSVFGWALLGRYRVVSSPRVRKRNDYSCFLLPSLLFFPFSLGN